MNSETFLKNAFKLKMMGCPYEPGTALADAWLFGFLAAQEALEKSA